MRSVRGTVWTITRLMLGLVFVFAVCAMESTTVFAGNLVKKSFSAKLYSGSRARQYQVFVPSRYTGTDPVPMVMVLHGCKQTEQNMVNETRFKDLAEQENFIVVYPFVTSYDGARNLNCWGFWFNQHIHQGGGEAEDLHQIALEVESQFKIDPERRYITGLSSGAAMSVVMAVAQSEYFAAAGSDAGLPYSETSSSVGFVCANSGTFKSIPSVVSAIKAEQKTPKERRKIPIMTIHSNNDCTVNKKGSENIRDSWIQRYGASTTPVETLNCTKDGVSCTQKKYGTTGRSVAESIFYEGATGDFTGKGSHYWVGDNAGEFANPKGPSASELFWDFFKRHPFSENRPPLISISSATVSGNSIQVNGSASDPDGAVAEVLVRLAGPNPQAAKTALGTTAWSVNFDNLTNNSIYTPFGTAKDNEGATTSVPGTEIPVGTPPPNQPPSVTINNVAVNGSCVTVTGAFADPDDTVAKVEVELGTRGFKSANLEGNQYRHRECGLIGGSYTTKSTATDGRGASTTVAGIKAKVENLEVVIANWLGHMNSGRLKIYSTPCPIVGFGSCDVGFQTIFYTQGFNQFALYKASDSNAWYLDPANIVVPEQ